MKRAILPALFLALLLSGCARKKRVPASVPAAPPAALRVGLEEFGIASWYGHPYHGRRSSSGEIYDMEKLTAAHRTLPFGTRVRVDNLRNKLSVDVRINDRGPFIDGRIIDLSRAAARKIEMIGPGTAQVRVRILSLPENFAAGYYAVQVGAFRERVNAERARDSMQRRYGSARVAPGPGNPPMWRVVVGREPTPEAAGALAERIRAEAGPAFIVRVEEADSNL